ncbi:uncharacterized protein MELLADRAFT_61096 [Melampsora larici-populina 98AG31]|uniref:Uncharacterized protein n=1 Tax=Melampsora larici-populina (strain 98AG31 / pathotype 3-4-7) TaxID=747676 RepID=F4RDL1_MELLP|nr:uncharacterized protein MELLADRAFT_61096 [Melampsora larici-populina 98AG31]EGG09590.1 hypothetical protein MELLADRAFT_61096 [Melampsora larici-populina 98AG31]
MPLKRTKRSPAVVMKINLKSFEPDLSQVLESPPSSAASTVLNFDEPTANAAEAPSNSSTVNEVSISSSSSNNITNSTTSSSIIGSSESSSTPDNNSSNSSTSSSEVCSSSEIRPLRQKRIRSPQKGDEARGSKRKREVEEPRKKIPRRDSTDAQPESSKRLSDPELDP